MLPPPYPGIKEDDINKHKKRHQPMTEELIIPPCPLEIRTEPGEEERPVEEHHRKRDGSVAVVQEDQGLLCPGQLVSGVSGRPAVAAFSCRGDKGQLEGVGGRCQAECPRGEVGHVSGVVAADCSGVGEGCGGEAALEAVPGQLGAGGVGTPGLVRV